MPAIGITGGIATGKSSFVRQLRELSAGTIFDADVAARELPQSDPEARRLIVATFGPQAYLGSGDLNREYIRTIVFADPDKRRALEQILHPRIRRQWSEKAERFRHSRDLFLADIPLLYETEGEKFCDRVVVVACAPEIQRTRLMNRMQLDGATADQMIATQMPLPEKIGRADHLVWNNGPERALAEQARLLVEFWKN